MEFGAYQDAQAPERSERSPGAGVAGNAGSIADLFPKLVSMQRLCGSTAFALLTVQAHTLLKPGQIECVVQSPGSQEQVNSFIRDRSEFLLGHLYSSPCPLILAPRDAVVFEHSPATIVRTDDGTALHLAFPVQLGTMGNGFVVFFDARAILNNDLLMDMHRKSVTVMRESVAPRVRDVCRYRKSQRSGNRVPAACWQWHEERSDRRTAQSVRSHRQRLSGLGNHKAQRCQSNPGNRQGNQARCHRLTGVGACSRKRLLIPNRWPLAGNRLSRCVCGTCPVSECLRPSGCETCTAETKGSEGRGAQAFGKNDRVVVGIVQRFFEIDAVDFDSGHNPAQAPAVHRSSPSWDGSRDPAPPAAGRPSRDNSHRRYRASPYRAENTSLPPMPPDRQGRHAVRSEAWR